MNFEESILEERIDQISRLKRSVGRRQDRRIPLNIVLIGTTGCGKSSFINSFAASIADDHWREFAFSGRAGQTGNQMTACLKRFEGSFYSTSDRFKGYALPTLIDLAGLENETGEVTEEILRLICYGKLKDQTNINYVYKFAKRWGVKALRWRYAWQSQQPMDDCRKVDRIVVIASANEIPTNLLHCVMKVARPSDGIYTREIPVFGILTKSDQLDESCPEFVERKQKFQELLAAEGASHRFLQCVNYCDDIDPTMARLHQTLPDVDVPILRFMNVVCGSNYEVSNPTESYRETIYARLWHYVWHRMTESPPQQARIGQNSGIEMIGMMVICLVACFLMLIFAGVQM